MYMDIEFDPSKKRALGQYFTPESICKFMASLFTIKADNYLLDPGCGVGSLTYSFLERVLSFEHVRASVDMFEVDSDLAENIFREAARYKDQDNITINVKIEDFIATKLSSYDDDLYGYGSRKYTHVITNPPYKKIGPKTIHGRALNKAGLNTINLYSAFVMLSIKLLQEDGELVCIIPRSFCNGTFYKSFRKLLFTETSVRRIHIFDSRTEVFSGDKILQENVIIHCIKNKKQGKVTISSSSSGDFYICKDTGNFTATGYSEREVEIDSIVNPADEDLYIHIATSDEDQEIIKKIETFSTTLEDIGVEISTGPVVDFRLKDYLSFEKQKDSVPLLFPVHASGSISWPKKSKKPNYIKVTNETDRFIWDNNGSYVIVRRFSSKEEKKRVVASYYDSNLKYSKIAFDNKLNIFHCKRSGIDKNLAKGLFVYISSTFVDKYFRSFSGHTQINATDFRKILYPSKTQLIELGKGLDNIDASQESIDNLIKEKIARFS